MTDLKSKAKNGLKWSAIERIATQFIQLVVMLLLGRILGPESFGLIGMLSIFIAISQTFVDSGFGNALIRKIDRNEVDYSTTFYFSIAVSLVCYIALYLSAPYIADFYGQQELIQILRVLSLTIIINSVSIVHRTRFTIDMNFKLQAKISLLSVLFSSIVALLLGYFNYSVWALVGQSLTFSLLSTILIYYFSGWRPKEKFCKHSFYELFNFGSKLLVSSLIDTIYNNLYQIIIGKLFSPAQLGIFSQAKNLSNMPAMTLTSIIQRVTYPMLSQIQDDTKKLDDVYLLTLRLSALVIFPIMVGIAIVAKPLVQLSLGDNWADSAYLMSILCFGYMLYPIHAINLNLLKVKGRSDLFLKIEILKKIMITLILFITVPLGIKAICIGMLIQSYIGLVINTYYSGKMSKLNIVYQLKAIFPIWVSCIFIGSSGYYIFSYINNDVIKLIGTLLFSMSLYFLYVFKYEKDLFGYIKETIIK